MTKICRCCRQEKDTLMFPRKSGTIDGYYYYCKECKNEYNKKWRDANSESVKECKKKCYQKHRQKNLKKNGEYSKKWHKDNPEISKEKNKKYKQEHSDKINKRSKERRIENPEKYRKYSREYNKERQQKDINYRLTVNLRKRLNCAIKNNQKSGSAVSDLGCTVEFLKLYLESKFQEGMSWDNYGKWHIDHIIPLSSFDLTDREQFFKANHYTNLQPLWAIDNMKKGAKILTDEVMCV